MASKTGAGVGPQANGTSGAMLGSSSKEARPPGTPPRRIELKALFLGLLSAWVALMAVFVGVARLWGWELVLSSLLGTGLGIGLSLLYFVNQKKKVERNSRLAAIAGVKAMQQLLHQVPTWISFREQEKVEWLNAILAKAWPYYDAAICATIKEQVEPLMMQYKPPGLIKRIYFQKLTFGDDPFRVEGIQVDRERKDEVQIEVHFRWAGDANIVMGIELFGESTRLAPKVTDMAVSGVMRITLKPLVEEIPGFGAATVSLMRQPVVRFKLNFGSALGGGVTAGAIRAWLDPFMREQLAGMLVWPKRMVVPLLPPEVTGPLDSLELRHKGVLQLDVVEARDLPKVDAMGSADPHVEAWTLAEYVSGERDRTDTRKNTLNPTWNQRMWLLVQEPDTQMLRIAVYDTDYVNVKELLRINVLKGAASVFGSKTLLGRTMFRIEEAADRPGQHLDHWLPLGTDEFNELADSCGTGRGELHVRITYWPFHLLTGHSEAGMGAVLVTLYKCNELVPMDRPLGTSDPYVHLKLNKEVRESAIVYGTLDPVWGNGVSFEWYKVPSDEFLKIKVPSDEFLKIKVMDYDTFSADECMGFLEIDIGEEIAKAPQGDVTRTWKLEDVPTDWMTKGQQPKQSTITLRVQWIPFK
ncbi:hypothetical protein N2152v2_000431 [Parachlorella kessleri]